ncbi:MAG: hypothetical protein A2233_02705 [Candidatus Kerfeldbacteria bacterium RIFOXYA2_FULL_38_24]|nr:MAG: hypothetical protein A2233_02705 [Candidatus Kerfeldbacteria bacterium RIFOXYA2_FULL_38_24]OGY89698.1 MAG: hypothetical protein A2458_03150 [Candidatus Kerfeldbacteria bacterium RIFOXYC2_FULL_38_9]
MTNRRTREPGAYERSPETALRKLATEYLKKPYIISGATPPAVLENRKVDEVLCSLAETFAPHKDHVFGIFVTGSRVLGYNKLGSDLDIDYVTHGIANVRPFNESVIQALQQQELDVAVENAATIDDHLHIPEDPQEFVSLLDKEPELFAYLFGYFPYQNENLWLTRLSALAVWQNLDAEHWQDCLENAVNIYAESWSPVITKMAEPDRFGLPAERLKKIFPKELFKARAKKFGLPQNPAGAYKKLLKWYQAHEAELQDAVMLPVYQGVLKEL